MRFRVGQSMNLMNPVNPMNPMNRHGFYAATGLHALDNPWQEAIRCLSVASEAQYEQVQAPRSRDFQLLAAIQV
jgi:hypothetical protein